MTSRIITATSPNWRSASTSTTGRAVRRAREVARFVATTLLPDPPLVDDTVMTRPSGVSSSADVGNVGTIVSVRDTRSTDSISDVASVGAPSTSRTPDRSACCRRLVDSSAATRMAPASGRTRVNRSISASPGSSARPGPNTTTSGRPGGWYSANAATSE